MYSRSYYQEEEKLTPPENYNGVAFSQNIESPNETGEQVFANSSEFLTPPKPEYTKEASHDSESVLTGLSNLPLLSGLFGKCGNGIGLPKIGTEEILILAAAAFLFFSKNGDKETAIILLVLLLIN